MDSYLGGIERNDDKSITLLPIRVQTCPTRKRCNLKHWCKARVCDELCRAIQRYRREIMITKWPYSYLPYFVPMYRDVVYRSSLHACCSCPRLYIDRTQSHLAPLIVQIFISSFKIISYTNTVTSTLYCCQKTIMIVSTRIRHEIKKC